MKDIKINEIVKTMILHGITFPELVDSFNRYKSSTGVNGHITAKVLSCHELDFLRQKITPDCFTDLSQSEYGIISKISSYYIEYCHILIDKFYFVDQNDIRVYHLFRLFSNTANQKIVSLAWKTVLRKIFDFGSLKSFEWGIDEIISDNLFKELEHSRISSAWLGVENQ